MSKPFEFDPGTLPAIQDLINRLYENKRRVRIFYGDPVTGESWNEEYDVVGHVGKSTGEKPCALMIHNARSMGGGALLTACIIKVIDIDSRRVLYEHPRFTTSFARAVVMCPSDVPGYGASVTIDGNVQARFRTPAQAGRYIEYMTGKRFTK